MRCNETKNAQKSESTRLCLPFCWSGRVTLWILRRRCVLEDARLQHQDDAVLMGCWGKDADVSMAEPIGRMPLTSFETSVTSGDLRCDPRAVCSSMRQKLQ